MTENRAKMLTRWKISQTGVVELISFCPAS